MMGRPVPAAAAAGMASVANRESPKSAISDGAASVMMESEYPVSRIVSSLPKVVECGNTAVMEGWNELSPL